MFAFVCSFALLKLLRGKGQRRGRQAGQGIANGSIDGSLEGFQDSPKQQAYREVLLELDSGLLPALEKGQIDPMLPICPIALTLS
jgi:hypothetical protein